MKRALYFFLLLIPFTSPAQGDLGFYLEDVKEVPSDYATVSKTFDDGKKETLHAVRAYIEGKEAELSDIEDKIDILQKERAGNMVDTVIGEQYLNLIDSMGEESVINSKIKHLLGNLGYMPQFYGDKKVSDLEPLTERVRKKVVEVKKDDAAIKILHVSRKNLVDDINKAQLRIDGLYGKLYDDGKFKIWITGIFSFIVSALLILFFVFISRKSDTHLAKDFLSSGNGLQFITLFSLIIAIILFGVLGVLEGRELAAILSGISGYILGKGIQRPNENKNQGSGKDGMPASDRNEAK